MEERSSFFEQGLPLLRHLIALAIAIQALAFLSIAPAWLFACLGMFCLFLYVRGLAQSRFLRVTLLLTCLALFFIDYRLAYSVEMASVFLLLVASMKATELSGKRDVLVFVYSMFYLSAVSMLFEQSIGHVMLQLSCVVLCLSLLMRLNDSSLGSVRSQLWRVMKMLSLAVPFAVCFFLFFPRFAPLWSLPIKTSHSQTGMSEEMTPGSIAELSQSAERAFRVTFNGPAPERRNLYWRAMLLDHFDGRTWKRSFDALFAERAREGLLYNNKYEVYEPQAVDGPYYDMILEPHHNRWAFSLVGSTPASGNVHRIGGGIYEFRQDVASPTPYRMVYDQSAVPVPSVPGAMLIQGVERRASPRQQDLQLPSSGNPLARQLVDRLLALGPTEMGYVAAVLRFFYDEGFGYTLKPPLLGQDTIDDFLFGTRLGFCEHFASSAAFLFREAGLPARVVTGYQGGELNSDLGYWVVRQYDAHAWVEVYINGTGWLRVDPTAYIAPDRIERNLEEAVKEEGTFLSDNRFALLTRSVAILNWIGRRSDELNYRWQRFVLGYGEQDQRKILKSLFGEFNLRFLLWTLCGVFFALVVFVVIYIWLGRYRRSLSREERSYLRFLLLLRLAGVQRETGETPQAFVDRTSDNLRPFLHRLLEKRTSELYKSLYNVPTSNH
jgi:transglutaminase-like putative cysteine protease